MGDDEKKEVATVGAPLPESMNYRLFLVCFGMIQITLGAGIIVGWAGIAGSMLVEKPQNGGAGLTLDQTTKLFGMAASVNYVSPFFLGMILDNAGPRACSVTANTIVALGCIIFSVANEFSIFAAGLALIAFGGPGVQTSLMHIGNLFPDRRFFVMGIVAESITLSFAVLPVLDVIWEAWPDCGFRKLFAGLGTIVFLSAISSFFLWPDTPYVTPPEESEDDAATHVLLPHESDMTNSSVKLQDRSFKEQATSGVFTRLWIFFLVTSWWANFYIAIVTTELGDQQKFTLEEQHSLTRYLSFIDAGAIVCAPLSGFLLESVGFNETAFITITLGVLEMVLLLVAGNSFPIMIASFVCYAVFRAFLFPYFFASLSRRIGFRFFGMLVGIGFCLSGLSQLTIAPVASFFYGTCHKFDDITDAIGCDTGSWGKAHLIQIGTLIALLLIPIIDWYTDSKKKEKDSKLLDTSTLSYGSISSSLRLAGANPPHLV